MENSIDARAEQVVIVRGKKKGKFYLKVSDDGEGIPRNRDGLLSFWTVGQKLSATCSGADGKTYEMTMARDSPDFSVRKKRVPLPFKGTDLTIYPLLPGYTYRRTPGELWRSRFDVEQNVIIVKILAQRARLWVALS